MVNGVIFFAVRYMEKPGLIDSLVSRLLERILLLFRTTISILFL